MTQERELMECDFEVVFTCDVKGIENELRLRYEIMMMEVSDE